MRDGVTVGLHAAGVFYWHLEGWLNYEEAERETDFRVAF